MRNDQGDVAAARGFHRKLRGASWRRSFGDPTLVRGLRYQREGRVDPLWTFVSTETGFELEGEVGGSRGFVYESCARFFPIGDRLELSTRCSCPVGVRCKHVVALIEAFLAHPGFEPEGTQHKSLRDFSDRTMEVEWARWLDAVSRPLPASETKQIGAEHRLVLYLDTQSDLPFPRFVVSPVWVRPAKAGDGRLVAPKSLRWQGLRLEPEPEGGWEPGLEDRLLPLLSEPARYIGGPAIRARLVHRFQASLLRDLLEDPEGPLVFHLHHQGPVLGLGARRRLESRWESEGDGMHRLRVRLGEQSLEGSPLRLAQLGDELWYLDPEGAAIGPVDGDARLALWGTRAPRLPASKVSWLAKRMGKMDALPRELVPPVARKTVELPPVAPRLRLCLDVLEGDRRPGSPEPVRYGAARPGFRYGDLLLPADGGALDRIERDDVSYRVPRDPEAEAALLASLPPELVRSGSLAGGEAPRRGGVPPETLLLKLAGERIATPGQWWPTIARLRRAGVEIEFAPGFPAEPERRSPDAWHGRLEAAGPGWFELGLDIEVDGARIDLLPLLRGLLADPSFPLTPGPDERSDATWEVLLDDTRLLELPLARLRPLLGPLLDWFGDREDGEALRVPLPVAVELDGAGGRWKGRGRKRLRELRAALAELPDAVAEVPGLAGSLRPYQARGVAWLRRLSLLGLGGLLADDMGLGKTVQILAHVLDERARGAASAPVLVVAPTSLVANWCAEAERFSPTLRVLQLQRSREARAAALATIGEADLVVTTYALLVRDLGELKTRRFSLVVLDEAQAIKNAGSQAARAVRALQADRRIAMTGTPVENHLGELWAQIDAVAPGHLGDAQGFGHRFRKPIERDGDDVALARLRRRIEPLLLRRTRDEVLRELPPKAESVRAIVLEGAQRDLYETLRLAQHQRIRESIAARGLAGSGIVMLDALLKLRQVCCDPRLVKLASARRVERSAKLDELRSLLATLLEEGRRVLVFSQFAEMLEHIGKALLRDRIPFVTLTGKVPGRERKARIDRFQAGEVPLFLISLKAGGAGLNLPAADTVIHYDPWWNPAVEAQATGRAHRMGQTRPVHVYKLVCAGTVEERITALQREKAELAASILTPGAKGAGGPLLDEAELEALFAPLQSP